ncbi:DUF5130 family protein [Saccharothrix yanglingensis]|uniref:DUF5130 domain-containing protein n=1 Tax=Saccharothrix yanglingensis TaxID=659496 RepID=A0ABU0X5U0_9PSEU|nr:DUF5130 family protein [Saccharothrix yanglingensis]MDQ2587501.1 DUF5130 domain-containing protein [Saccharothrix yanglingensis]
MATGELNRVEVDPSTLPVGAAVTNSGRVSVARMHAPHAPSLPFTPVQLATLDEALTLASRTTGLDFSVYLGALGSDSRARAEELHAATPRPAHAVLVAVSPGERVVEVVTGEESHRRLADRGAKLAVMSMVASFKEGDLAGGLLSGLRMLADQAGRPAR